MAQTHAHKSHQHWCCKTGHFTANPEVMRKVKVGLRSNFISNMSSSEIFPLTICVWDLVLMIRYDIVYDIMTLYMTL